MRTILLATTLLSIALSENIMMENHPRLKTAWICNKQLWNRKTKRIPRKDMSSTIEDSLNYEDRQFPRISDTRFMSESRKLLPSTIIRRHELARIAQDDLAFDKSKFDNTKPRVLISIGIKKEKNNDNALQDDCSKRKNYCRYNHGWQHQQPFYVEEPTWVDIDNDYLDSSQRTDNSDPYILTRGKKIYRIKNPEQVVGKTIEDYEATFDYPSSDKKLLLKNRVRRSAKTTEGSQDKIDIKNQIKERIHYDTLPDMNRNINNTLIVKMENSGEKFSKINKISEETAKSKDNYNVFSKNYKKNDLKNLAKRSLRRFKFTRQNQILANGIITDFIEQKHKIQRKDIPDDIENDSSKPVEIDQIERFNNSHFAININKRNKKVMLKNQEFFDIRKKREIYDVNAYSKKDDEKKETYEQINPKIYINKLNDPDSPDNFFILPRNKDPFHNEIKSLNKKDTDPNKSIEKARKLYYMLRKKLEKETKNETNIFKINKDNIGIIDLQLTNESNSKNSEIKTSNYRDKRNICQICKIKSQPEDEWLMDIEKKIQESLSLERRNKHRDILERLNEPYIISRGKKDFEKNVLSSLSNSQNINGENHVKMKSLLRILMQTSRCNNDNCDINANRLNERLLPRDRRGTLDEIFAEYDPYYVARGKRMNRNEEDVSFEMDSRQ